MNKRESLAAMRAHFDQSYRAQDTPTDVRYLMCAVRDLARICEEQEQRLDAIDAIWEDGLGEILGNWGVETS